MAENGTYLHEVKALDEHCDERHESTRSNSELPMEKGVLSFIVLCLERLRLVDHKDDISRGGNVEDLHDGIVDRIEGGEEVEITANKDNEIELLGLHRDANGIPGGHEAHDEEEDGEDVAHVPREAKDIHHFEGRQEGDT